MSTYVPKKLSDDEKHYRKLYEDVQKECDAYKELIKQMKKSYADVNVSLNYQLSIQREAARELAGRNRELTELLDKINGILNFSETPNFKKVQLIRKEIERNGSI